MTVRLIAAAWVTLVFAGSPSYAHRLDEYLEATLISVEKDRIQAQVRLAPGVAVLPMVLAEIDINSDGVVSDAEQTAYAQRVLRELSLTVDADRLELHLLSLKFPGMEELREGIGEIQIEFSANVPPAGHQRRLVFENHHQSGIAAYLVNSTVPSDPGIQLSAQNRNFNQSVYQLDYEQRGPDSRPVTLSGWWATFGWLGAGVLLWSARVAPKWRKRRGGAASSLTC
jgi:hypothetical protein